MATALASAVFIVVLFSVGEGGPMVVPGGHLLAALTAVVVGLFVGSWCEEVGYRGVMYRAMASRWGMASTIVVNGLFFGLVHLQYIAGGVLPVLAFVSMAMLLDVAMATTWDGPWRTRVLCASVFHAVVNVAMQLRGLAMLELSDHLVALLAMATAAGAALVGGRLLRVGDMQRR